MPSTRARELRRKMTPAERRLWAVLRRRQLAGFRFRRQVPIGPFTVDFFCPKARLVIEVDGGHHSEETNRLKDQQRTRWLEAHGCRVIRVWNRDVRRRTNDIADAIYLALTAPLPPAFAGTFPHASRGEEELE